MKYLWKVEHEVGDGHFAAGQESRIAAEPAHGDQQTADQFDAAPDCHEGVQRHRHIRRRKAEQFLAAVEREHQTDKDP